MVAKACTKNPHLISRLLLVLLLLFLPYPGNQSLPGLDRVVVPSIGRDFGRSRGQKRLPDGSSASTGSPRVLGTSLSLHRTSQSL